MAALAGDLTKALLGQTDAAKAFRYTLVPSFLTNKILSVICFITKMFSVTGFDTEHSVRYQILRNMLVITFELRCHPHGTYKYRVQSSVWHLPNYFDPPPPLHPASVLPPHRAVRGWGVSILEDARHWVDLLQYNPPTVPSIEEEKIRILKM
jgi:hypothetical protein